MPRGDGLDGLETAAGLIGWKSRKLSEQRQTILHTHFATFLGERPLVFPSATCCAFKGFWEAGDGLDRVFPMSSVSVLKSCARSDSIRFRLRMFISRDRSYRLSFMICARSLGVKGSPLSQSAYGPMLPPCVPPLTQNSSSSSELEELSPSESLFLLSSDVLLFAFPFPFSSLLVG